MSLRRRGKSGARAPAVVVAACAIALAACGGSNGSSAAQRTGSAAAVSGGSGGSSGSSGSSLAARGAAGEGGDWTRFDFDAARHGVGPSDTGITSANVGGLKLRAVHIDGVADSSPVQLHDVTVAGQRRDVAVVTTTYGKTIAFDPGTGGKLWEFVPRDVASYEGSSQITTSTPVLDPGRRYVYTASPDGLIRKLSVTSGSEVRSRHWPARITLDPHREKIAPALNLSGRYVVAATGGYVGDAPSYQGHVALIDRFSGRVAHVWNSLCANRHRLIVPRSCPVSDSAIWARAGAVIEPGTGRILVATGNAPWNGSTNWGDSVLELSSHATRLLQNWTPANQAQLNADDADLGSTAPALLPAISGKHLAVQGGKDGHLYLLNIRRLNGTSHAGPRVGGQVQTLPSPGGAEIFTAPAVWSVGRRTYVFVADGSATAAYTVTHGRNPRLREVWHNDSAGTSPLVAGGLLYVYDPGGRLRVLDPTTGRELASFDSDSGHWSSPIVTGGRVLLPVGGSTSDDATSGLVLIYHLPGR